MALGAGLGMVFGLIGFDDWWLGPLIGVAVGLIVGAIMDSQGSGDGKPR
jgi:purine-cytosine permease-like protein